MNVNRVYGIHATDVQAWMPSLAFLGLHMMAWPLCVYLPTHLIFRKLFREPAGAPAAFDTAIAPEIAGGR